MNTTLEGDTPCVECDTMENIVWFTDSVFWNEVCRRDGDDPYGYADRNWGGDPILCITCFVAIAESRGFRPTAWKLTPEWPWRRGDA